METIEGDAAAGLAGDRQFDRIIATAGVHLGQFPYSWVERTIPGGVIVARYDVWKASEYRPGVAWLVDPLSGSWASVVPEGERFRVRQVGPRRLWDAAEAAYRWWVERGEPPLSAWEWTITPDRQSVTLPPDSGR